MEINKNEEKYAALMAKMFNANKTEEEIIIKEPEKVEFESKIKYANINPKEFSDGIDSRVVGIMPNLFNPSSPFFYTQRYKTKINGEDIYLALPPEGVNMKTKLSSLTIKLNKEKATNDTAKAIMDHLNWKRNRFVTIYNIHVPGREELNDTFEFLQVSYGDEGFKAKIEEPTKLSQRDRERGKKPIDIQNPLHFPELEIVCKLSDKTYKAADGTQQKPRDYSESKWDKEEFHSIKVNGRQLDITKDDLQGEKITQNRIDAMNWLVENLEEPQSLLTFKEEEYDLVAEAKIIEWINFVLKGKIGLNELDVPYSELGLRSSVKSKTVSIDTKDEKDEKDEQQSKKDEQSKNQQSSSTTRTSGSARRQLLDD